MIFNKKQLNELEQRVQTLETFRNSYISKLEWAEMIKDVAHLKGIVGALLEHLDVYPHKELVVDNRCLPPEIQMTEVYRVKPSKYCKTCRDISCKGGTKCKFYEKTI